jgi:hypothetical protein
VTPYEHTDAFSPFHHEIFAVVQDLSATSVTVEELLHIGRLEFAASQQRTPPLRRRCPLPGVLR